MPCADPMCQRVLQQIETFSARLLVRLGLPKSGSPHGGREPLQPLGLVMHYTADPRLQSVLQWLCDPTSLRSTHFVVAQSKHPLHDELSGDLEEVAHLPATVVQLRPTSSQAWHATWANRWAFGVEMCNAGELRRDASGVFQPVAQVSYDRRVAPELQAGRRVFSGYPEAQLLATLVLCRSLAKCFALQPARVVGHDMIQGQLTKVRGAAEHDKRDVGGFSLDAWRRAVFGSPDAIPMKLQEAITVAVDGTLFQSVYALDAHFAKRRLAALGYAVDSGSVDWSPTEKESVGLFQVLMGLVPDRFCGPKTSAALYARCKDRFGDP